MTVDSAAGRRRCCQKRIRISTCINIRTSTERPLSLWSRNASAHCWSRNCRVTLSIWLSSLPNFASITNNNNFNFDLRIFVPEVNVSKTVFAFLTRKKAEKWFVIRNIEPFAKRDITEHLRFRVEPDIQGLVGEAYKSGFIVYDDMLEVTNNTKYSLDKAQLSRTSKLLWSLCVPILNDNNEVFAVMAFDSDSSPLDISSNKEEIRSLTNTLAI